MYDKGLITKPKIKEVGAADIVGPFVGWTGQLVMKAFEEAKGGALFIDEALVIYAIVRVVVLWYKNIMHGGI